MSAGNILNNTFQIGDCLGKGAFGAVYRCLNIENGECIAIKQIKLTNISKPDLGVIVTEIELLRKLHHENIVKYLGSFKTNDDLNIMLEFCENGSLTSIYKKFGRFPENLVGVYISQVLQGLNYLHNQGVIHRDVKGANILTTKDGQVKLADFGVATRLGDIEENTVVGSPYWMAPEVIELAGSHPVSDIWSVGCTTIELIQGSPPYFNLSPMQALFRIVQDEHPPLPEGISGALKDFLLQCFQKDVNLRVNAAKLLKHPWIQNCRTKFQQSHRKSSAVGESPKQDFVVKSVKEFNQSIESPIYKRESNNASEDSKASKKFSEPDNEDENWDDDFILDGADSKLSNNNNSTSKKNAPALPQSITTKSSKKILITPEKQSDNWDSDFEFVDKSNFLPAPNAVVSAASKKKSNDKIEIVENEDDDYSSAFIVDSSANIIKFPVDIDENEKNDVSTEDDDPFLSFDNELEEIDFGGGNALSERKSKLWGDLEDLMKLLNPDAVAIEETCKRICSILSEIPSLRSQFIKLHGALLLIDLVERFNHHSALKHILMVLNQFIDESAEIQENICLVGGLPIILKLSRKENPKEVIIEVGKTIQQLCKTSNTTLQMFITCRGLNVLVELLDMDYQNGFEIIWLAVEGISSVFELQGVTSKNDFCMLLAKHNLIPKLMKTLKDCAHDTNPVSFEFVTKIINICNILSNSDNSVRLFLSKRYVISHMIDLLDKLPPLLVLNCLKCFKNLSSSTVTLDALEKANLIEKLIEMLERRNEPYINEIFSQVLVCIFNLCRLSKRRQEIAANAGIIPHLQYIVSMKSQLKQFALPILCDFAHAGKKCRERLLENNGLEFFIQMLGDQYWQANALESIYLWLVEEPDIVEPYLCQQSSIDNIINAFKSSKGKYENLVDPLHKIVMHSVQITRKFVGDGDVLITVLLPKLNHPKPLFRLTVIKILARLLDYHKDLQGINQRFSLNDLLQKTVDMDGAVLVKEMAQKMLLKLN